MDSGISRRGDDMQLRYDRWFSPLAAALGMGPNSSRVTVDHDAVHVKNGWAFYGTVPLANIVSATPNRRPVLSRGVHGWRGRWLVNGSSAGVVTLGIDPPVSAWALGFPVKVKELKVSVTEPDALIAACTRA
jgi:hypothetical protein